VNSPVHEEAGNPAHRGVVSRTHRIGSSAEPSLFLHIRERRPADGFLSRPTPLLLVHGATVPSVLWDTPLPGWSWMDRLAADGFHVFAVDLRGYGGSSRPPGFAEPPEANPAYARARDVVADVADAVGFILSRTGADRIDLLGGSWGSVVCGKFVAEAGANKVRRLVLYAPLYCEPSHHPVWLGSAANADAPEDVAREIGAYRRVSGEELRARWDAEIPVDEKSSWRADGVLEALVASCLADEDGAKEATGFKVPNGTLVDLHSIFNGKPLYESRDIRVPTLLVRGSADPTSTNGDAGRLFDRLSSPVKRYVIVGNGAHFMIAEKKTSEVHAVVAGFLSEDL